MIKEDFICPCCGLPRHLEVLNEDEVTLYTEQEDTTEKIEESDGKGNKFTDFSIRDDDSYYTFKQVPRRDNIQKRFNTIKEVTDFLKDKTFKGWAKENIVFFIYQDKEDPEANPYIDFSFQKTQEDAMSIPTKTLIDLNHVDQSQLVKVYGNIYKIIKTKYQPTEQIWHGLETYTKTDATIISHAIAAYYSPNQTYSDLIGLTRCRGFYYEAWPLNYMTFENLPDEPINFSASEVGDQWIFTNSNGNKIINNIDKTEGSYTYSLHGLFYHIIGIGAPSNQYPFGYVKVKAYWCEGDFDPNFTSDSLIAKTLTPLVYTNSNNEVIEENPTFIFKPQSLMDIAWLCGVSDYLIPEELSSLIDDNSLINYNYSLQIEGDS